MQMMAMGLLVIIGFVILLVVIGVLVYLAVKD
jgi:hypothetical protein